MSRTAPHRKTFSAALATLALMVACTDQSTESLVASARALDAKSDTAGALVQLRNAIQQDPDSADARYLFGKVLLHGGDPVNAAVELRKASALKHPDDDVVPELARAMLAQGLNKQLVEEFGEAKLGSALPQGDLQTSVASAYAALGMYPESEVALQAALREAPVLSRALILQGQMLVRQGKLNDAMKLIAGLLERNPRDAAALRAQAGMLLIAKRDPVAAYDTFVKAIEADPTSIEAHAGAISILIKREDDAAAAKQLAELRKVAPNHPQTRYFDAQLAFRKRDFTRARALLQDLLRTAPDDPRILQLAGAAELELGSPVHAQAYLQKAMQTTGDQPMTRQLLAQAHLGTGEPAKALDVLKPLMQRDADSATLALAAQANLMTGSVKAGEQLFEKAAKLDTKDIRSRTALALAQIGHGKADTGFKELAALAAGDPGTTADVALITAHLARKEFDAALRAVDAVDAKSTDKAFAASLRGRVQLLAGDLDAARASFDRALAVNPNLFAAISALSAIDLAQKKPDAARARLQAVVQKDPKNVQALLALADLGSRTGASSQEIARLLDSAVKANPNDASARTRLTDHYLANQQPRLALTTAQNGLAAAPTSREMLELVGRAQMASGEYQQAMGSFTRLVALPPESANAHLRLAEAQIAVKNNDAARISLKRALALSPDLIGAQQRLIAVELASGRTQEAVAWVRTVQKQRPREAVGHILEGDLETARKNPAAAATAYRAAMKIEPTPALALRLHSALVDAKKTADANRFAEDWQREHPTDAAFVFHLADVAFRANDYAGAESRYREVIQRLPDHVLALNNLAWVMTLQGKRGAIDYAEKATTLRPDQPALMGTLAAALALEGQYDRAIELQRKAVELQPQTPLFRLNLARIYLKASRKAQAEQELGELAKLGDRFSGQADVAELMKSIKGG